jgi:hypothetical protein
LIPNITTHDTNKAIAAAKRIRSRAVSLKSGAFDWQEWKTYRDDGRA